MKSIILAAAATPILTVAATVVFRLRPTDHRARKMVIIFLCAGIALALVWEATTDDLGVLPEWLLTRPRWLDLALTLFLFTAAFFGEILQLYNLADRGLSLRILIDISENPDAISSADDIVAGYSGGQGLLWMYDKRLHGLLEHNFVSSSNGSISLTRRGYRSAAFFLGLRRFCKLEA